MLNKDYLSRINYIDFYKQKRELVEELIDKFFRNEKGVRVPLIVAPYGSGKTTLIKTIAQKYWKKGIPVLIVNLGEIVEYIKDQISDKKIQESKLPQYFINYFKKEFQELRENIEKNEYKKAKEKLRKILDMETKDPLQYLGMSWNIIYSIALKAEDKGLMLIDEVEEAYNSLKQIVEYETIPLREFADRIYEHKTNYMAVLVYGPKTIASELTSYSGWRFRLVSLPPISVDYIYNNLGRGLEEVLYGVKEDFKSTIIRGLCNTTWWLAKGRPAWINKVIQSGIIHRIAHIIRDALEDKASIRNLYFEITADKSKQIYPILGDKIIENVPLFSISTFRNDYDFFSLKEENTANLLLLLTILQCPLSKSFVSKIIKNFTFTEEDFIIASKYFISVENLISCIEEYIRKIVKEEIEEEILSDILSTIRIILETLAGYDGLLLCDKEYIKELKEVVLPAIQDLVHTDEKILFLINEMDFRYLYETIPEDKKVLKEISVALRPSKILSYYPLTTAVPLLGKARHYSKYIHSRLLKLDSHDIEEYSIQLSKELYKRRIISNEDLLVVPCIDNINYKILINALYKLISRGIFNEEKTPYIILLIITNNLDKMFKYKKAIEKELYGLERLGNLHIDYATGLLGVFLKGLIYNILESGSAFPERMSSLEEIVYRSYITLLRNKILSIQSRMNDNRMKFSRKLRDVFSGEISKKLKNISKNRAVSSIGGGHGKVIRQNAFAVNSLTLSIDLARDLYSFSKKIVKFNEYFKYDIKGEDAEFFSSLYRDISTYIKTKAQYLENVLNISRDLEGVVENNRDLKEVLKIISIISSSQMTMSSKPGAVISTSEKAVKTLLESIIMNSIPEETDIIIDLFLSYTIASSKIENIPNEVIREIENRRKKVNNCLKDIDRYLNTLRDKIDKAISLVKNISESNITLSRLQKIKAFIDNIDQFKKEVLEKYYIKTFPSSSLEFHELIGYYNLLYANEKSSGGFLYKAIRNMKSFLEQFYGELEANYLRNIYEHLSSVQDILVINDELSNALKKDLIKILNSSVSELDKVKQLDENLPEIMKNINKVYNEINKTYEKELLYLLSSIEKHILNILEKLK